MFSALGTCRYSIVSEGELYNAGTGATSTTEEVLSGVNLHGKRILVTGVSAGFAVETARSLAADGAQVAGAAREIIISGTLSNCRLSVEVNASSARRSSAVLPPESL